LVALPLTPKGRPRSIDADKIRELMGSGMGATAVAKKLGIGRASVYRLLRQPEAA
jgi:hypothetical protein